MHTLVGTHIVGITLALLMLTACAAGISESPGPATPKEPATRPAQSAEPGSRRPPEGDFMSRHTVRFYDGGEERLAEVADALSIERTEDNALRVKLNVVAGNFDECSFEDTMTPSGPNEWRWSEAEMYPDCVVVLTQTESEIVITSNWDCKDEFCGHRATLEGTFPLTSQRPLGSYVWPER